MAKEDGFAALISGEDEDGEESLPEGLEEAASEALKAMKADDTPGFARALHDAIRICKASEY